MHRFHARALAQPEAPATLKLSELISSLSHALDLTEGQPAGHCMRGCWIGMQLGRHVGVPRDEQHDLYYTLLLKDIGCSSNAARIFELWATDDLAFKRDIKTTRDRVPDLLRFVFEHTRSHASLVERMRATVTSLWNAEEITRELVATRCTRGAQIVRSLRFGERVAEAIHSLDERWDGGGAPEGLRGDAIPLLSRIALLAQVTDVFRTATGEEAALREVRARAGRWFDPRLVDALDAVAASPGFWETMRDPAALEAGVLGLAPAEREVLLDDDYLDDIAAAFGQVVDSKSPYTSGHSARVARYVDAIAAELGLSSGRRRWLRRAALLHDLGKLGVSNAILDKPGKLDADEWAAVQRHARFTEDILSRIAVFAELAQVAAAHHERLDGGGYPRGLKAADIAIETRIITVADVFDAISAERPYRGAVPIPKTLEIMAENVGTALDPDCFAALRRVLAAGHDWSRARG